MQRVAVLTLTRDRHEYTQHCFAKLRELAGCPYDHYVYDQASGDGTARWLGQWLREADREHRRVVLLGSANIGVSRGINKLIDRALRDGDYDMIVKFDNDCELTEEGTLEAALEVVSTGDWLASPRIQGLNEPVPVDTYDVVVGYRVGVVPYIGGIFLAAPASLYKKGYRHDESNPIWGMDDVVLGAHWKSKGGQLAYLLDYPANHYETTVGQRQRYPDYFARKDAEFAA